VLGTQASTTEGSPPIPEREMIAGEFAALLVTVTRPDMAPVARGSNVASRVADCPGARIKPLETPLTVYRAPEMVTFDTSTLVFPAFVRTTFNPLLFPVDTLPKFKLDVLVTRNAEAAIPIPLKETVLGDLETLLTTETLADKTPGFFGE
jgi:hypothetical protein